MSFFRQIFQPLAPVLSLVDIEQPEPDPAVLIIPVNKNYRDSVALKNQHFRIIFQYTACQQKSPVQIFLFQNPQGVFRLKPAEIINEAEFRFESLFGSLVLDAGKNIVLRQFDPAFPDHSDQNHIGTFSHVDESAFAREADHKPVRFQFFQRGTQSHLGDAEHPAEINLFREPAFRGVFPGNDLLL
ncbi:hypothetical protein SDC9_159990 [bioreactor metagenome]|uniref:Uncharacterized protein n=1 Tax=bioreactor metagenome TaxID=1076179 RepID=A0A645FE61_9ZZZZ